MIAAYIALCLLFLAVACAMWFGRGVLREHPIRTVAILFLGAMGVFLGYMAVWLTGTLSGPEWCAKALQAERISAQGFGGLTACVDLLKVQVQSIADVLKMSVGSFALGMIVLVVVVLAGSKASATLPGGATIKIGGGVADDPAAKAADKVAGAAVVAAAEVKTVVAADHPEYNGPAMPEPKGS